MAVSDEQIAFATDLFAEVPQITTRKMFGGLGIYSSGVIFALIMKSGTIMIKAKGDLADAMRQEGSHGFGEETDSGKGNAMPYWSLPEEALENPDLACDWARKSLAQNS